MYKRRLVTLLLVSQFVLSCSGSKDESNVQVEQVKSYGVKTVRIEQAKIYDEYPAVIQGEQEVEIRPKVDGYIEKIYVDEGASVRKGQILFKIFSPQYQQELRTAEAGVKTAEADLNTAKMEINKVRPLVDKEIVSKYSLQTAQFALETKKAALAQAQAAVINARTNVGYTIITSPVNGIIGRLPYKVGSLVSSTTAEALTTVVSSGNIYAYFGLNEKQLLEISRNYKGKTIQEKLKSLPDVSFILADGTTYEKPGKIQTASGLVTTETGSVDFRATFPNSLGILRSGSSGKIRLNKILDKVVLIPQSATYDLQGKRFIYTLNKDNTVKSIPIEVVPTPDGQSYAVEQGLKEGDIIVLEGTNELKNGAKISPKRL